MMLFWKTSRKAPDVGFKLAELISQKYPDQPYWDYLKGPLSSEISSFECGKDYIFIPLFEKAAQIATSNQNEFDKKVGIQGLASFDCYKKIIPQLKVIMSQSALVERKEQSFLLLDLLGHLKEDERELFLVEYMLLGPTKGDTLNLAWNNLKMLKNFPEKRSRILMDILSKDFIPDALFNTPDLDKKITLVEFISKTFPELLDAYAKTCLHFYQGKGEYPLGNPTRYCNEFIQLTNGKNWISPKTILEIKNAQKI